MLPPHQVPSWISATAHLAQMSSISPQEKRTPPPQPNPPPTPPPPADPDAPLNLSKPKSSSSGSTGSSPQSTPVQIPEHPIAATAPKLLPPNLMMSRGFLPPYAGLPPQFPMPTGGDRNKTKDMSSQEKQSPFPLQGFYGLPTPPHLGPRPKEEAMKEEQDFMACHCKYQYINKNGKVCSQI